MSKELSDINGLEISDRHSNRLEICTDGHLVDFHDTSTDAHIFEFNETHIDVLKKIIKNLEIVE
ncbi:hypothetical protein P9D26_18615 [Bacillus velezensis]|uniref:hypothetical protein n=1 Tax=Bacillus velezensis TaxID=492670 RepID=UPI002DB952CC|nr:hypothetical protein [Bacillus velezensis]MEC1395330.1 hypothetical protein [Bacillus velezensis]